MSFNPLIEQRTNRVVKNIGVQPDILAFLAVLMWSFSFPASKVAQEHFSPANIVFLRYVFASLFFAPFILSGRIKRIERGDFIRIIIPSLIGSTAYQMLFVMGIGRVTPAAASMIISSTPIFAALIGFVVLKSTLSRRQIQGTLLGFLGVILVCTSKGTDGGAIGFLIMLMATICMATYFILQKPLLEKYRSLDLVCYNTCLATLSMAWVAPDLFHSFPSGLPLQSIFSIAIMGVLSSGVGFVLWFRAIGFSGPAHVANYMYLQPVIVGLMTWVWIGAIPSVQASMGGAIVLLALIYMNLKRK